MSANGFGLASAVVYGIADVVGGVATRRIHVLTVLVATHALGLPTVLVAAVIGGAAVPPPDGVAWSVVGGTAEVAAAGLLYLALASGTMSVVSPLTAMVGAAIPLVVGLTSGEQMAPPQALGMMLAFGTIVLVSGPSRSDMSIGRRPIALAIASGGMFAISFIAFSTAESAGDPYAVAVLARSSGLIVVVGLALALRLPVVAPRGSRSLVAVGGTLDSLALVLLLMAYGAGPLGLTTVLISLYPAVTVLVAGVVLRERPRRTEVVAVATALMAVVLLAAA